MKQATAGDKPDWFAVPSALEKVAVCQGSGMRATPECRLAAANHETLVVDDYFPVGTAPKEPCTLHTVQLIGTSGGIQGLPAGQPAPRPPTPPSEHPLSEPLDGVVVKPRMTTP